jgi:DNA integrity scanning protein DisA with diadenylate cyclase activity
MAKMTTLLTLKADEALRQRLNALSRFALLDGAVLLTSEFELVGFGAKLRAEPFKENVIEGADGFGGGGQPFDFSRLGTRHNSALAFVAAVAGTVAFVASTDGPIRGIGRQMDGRIHCWPDCRLSMFA